MVGYVGPIEFKGEFEEVLSTSCKLIQEDGQEFISSLHLLRAILKHGRNQALRVLVQMGQTAESILPALVISDTDTLETATAPIPWPKKGINLAVQTAREWGDAQVGTEHLLMGLLLDNDCLAANKLRERLITAERTKLIIFALRQNPSPPANPALTDQELRENLNHILKDLQAALENVGAILQDLGNTLEQKK